MVSVGNEITNGMLWPLGGSLKGAIYSNVAPIIQVVSQAIRASYTGSGMAWPKIMTHCSDAALGTGQLAFCEGLFGSGLLECDMDVIAGFFYPYFSASATQAGLSNFFTTLSQKYNKPCMVVETNWPKSCIAQSSNPAIFASDLGGIKADNSGTSLIPFNAEGQAQWMQLISKTLPEVEYVAG